MTRKPEQMPFDLPGRGAGYAPEDFHASASNRDALAWIEKWPNWGAPLLILHGPPGSGKTHLLEIWRARAKAVAALADMNAAAWALDDADKSVIDEEGLFHLYNHAAAHGRHILLTASKPPSEWSIALPDLKSRLLAAPAAALGAPDDALLGIVLAKLFSDRQIAVPADVIAFLLPRIERSFAAARAVADRIDRHALAEKRAVTVPLVRLLLQDAETPGN